MSEIRALLLTDVVESTALSEDLGDEAAAELWAAHDHLARDRLPLWRGLEIDRTDGFLLMFESAADALGYALAYQRAVRALPGPVRVRVGLHVGPVLLRHNDPADVARGAKPVEVDGLAKPIAARVMAAARGGQTLLTRAARDAVGPIDTRIQSHGHWRLKGISEPIELFEAGQDDAPFMPPSDGDKAWRVVKKGELWLPVREVRHSLPAERDPFVGRQEPLRELARRFEDGARLVSILGTGGNGKTRLATRFGWTWLGDFPGGVWFCDLSHAREVDGMVSAVAQGLDVPPGQDEPIARLGAAIAGRGPCLVILDNFEQVAEHAQATLGRWLDAAPNAQFLVTTRQVLQLPGEQIYSLTPLPVTEAAELFTRRAHAANSQLALTPEDYAALGPLMELLDGLPLAIELAAARVRVMTPRSLLARMSERFRLLASSGRRHDRQATLRATFDWSWDLLSTSDKLALAQLSVFRGGFSLNAAEAVLDLSMLDDAPWPADTVQSLVDKSFVRPVQNARFDLLLSIQEYAGEHLEQEGSLPGSGPATAHAARARHCAYYAALGEVEAVTDGCADLDNLVTACQWAVSVGAGRFAADALEGAWAALRFRGPFTTGIDLAEEVAALPGLCLGDRARVELVAGSAIASTGRRPAAQAHFESALALAREAVAPRTAAHAQAELASQELGSGRMDEARSGFMQALALAREIGDHDVECSALNGLGLAADLSGRPDEVRGPYEAALALARRCGDRRWEGSVLGNLGSHCAALGQFNEARSCYEESLRIARELGDRQHESNALCNLGLVHFTQGDMVPARERSLAALDAAREMGHIQLECVVLCNLGLIEEAAGQFDQARSHFESTLALARELADRRTEGQILTYLGALHARQWRFEPAHRALDAGEALLQEMADPPSLALLRCARAEAYALAGALENARAALQTAEVHAAELGAGPESELGTAMERVRALLAQSTTG